MNGRKALSLLLALSLLPAANALAFTKQDADLVLPSALTEIGEQAFYEDVSIKSVYLQDKVTAIGSEAFAGCTNLVKIRIPAAVITIADNAFDGHSTGLVIYGQNGSEASRFASANKIRFEAEDGSGDILLPEI